jgi:pimeloyl-ACP methyl ester carboxylesterase
VELLAGGGVAGAVAILPAHGTARDDPLLYIEGGPGGASVAWFDLWMEDGWPSRHDRDLILLDQRGAGYSSPHLGCPEYQDADGFRELAALRRCHDRLVAAGIDLTTVSTPAHAADVEDLRIALGIDQWNLLGVSYGTRVALRVMDRYPNGVRSVVLDSAYPPEIEIHYHEAEVAAGALDALFVECGSAEVCATAYPDLAATFRRAVDGLLETPVEVEGYLVDGHDLVFAMIHGLYDPELTPRLPELIDTAVTDPHTVMAELFDDLGYLDNAARRGTVPTWMESDGTYYSVECREETSTIDRTRALIQASEVDDRIAAPLVGRLYLTLDICDLWTSGTAEPWEREPVESDIPALVVGGSLDPVTPPAWGAAVAERFPNGAFVEFPGHGHAVILDGECPRQLMVEHLRDPGGELDLSCVADRSVPWSIRR